MGHQGHFTKYPYYFGFSTAGHQEAQQKLDLATEDRVHCTEQHQTEVTAGPIQDANRNIAYEIGSSR